MTRVMQRTDAKRIRLREIDRIHAEKAKAEEQRCRNVIEAAGWAVTRVTVRYGESYLTIVNQDGTRRFGTPEDLARQVTVQRQRQETTMSDNSKGSPGFGAMTGSTPQGGDSRSPLSKRGGTKLETGGSKEK